MSVSMPAETPSRSDPFDCPYCGQRVDVSAELAGCVTPCPHCRRDVLVRELDDLSDPLPPLRSMRPFTPLAIVMGVGLGAMAGALLLAAPMWFYTLSIIGLGVRHISIAGLVGATIGAILGGLLGHRLCQE